MSAKFVAAAIAALALSGCAPTMSVSSHVAPGLDFTPYRTYSWGPVDALPTGDPRLDGNPYFQDNLQGAVEKQLTAKGFARDDHRPDLFVHYHASVTSRLNVTDASDSVSSFEADTIVLDIVDARTNRVIWRGWAQHRLAEMLANRDRMARSITDAVRQMLERLPDAAGGSVGTGAR